jgi:predicted NodU family carbamoyl transferase
MIVLGLHFGHDANMAIMSDGQLVSYFEKERHCRIKQALGLSSDDILDFLNTSSIDLEQVDVCAITTTQGVPIIDWDNAWSYRVSAPARSPSQDMTTIDSLRHFPEIIHTTIASDGSREHSTNAWSANI